MNDIDFATRYAQKHQEECLIDVMDDLDALLLSRGILSRFERDEIIVAAIQSIPGVVIID